MKNSVCRILSCLTIVTFLLYWISLFILAMPSNNVKNTITNNAPRFKTMFGYSWKLFTPPYTYNNRLYFIIMDIGMPHHSDTIEVLENISLQKQKRAPFNQKENILDHLINNNVSGLKKTVWFNKKIPAESIPGSTDSSYIARAVADAAYNKNYVAHLATLENYCRVILKEKKINTAGKSLKIVIKESMLRPFKERVNTTFLEKEILVFETLYKPFDE